MTSRVVRLAEDQQCVCSGYTARPKIIRVLRWLQE